MSDLNKRIVDVYGNPIKLENKITKTTIECKNSTWVRLAQMSCSNNFGQGLFRLSCYMDVKGATVPLISYQLAVSLLASEEWGIKSSIKVLSKTDSLRDLVGSDAASGQNMFFEGALAHTSVVDCMGGKGSNEAKILFKLHKLFVKNGVIKETLPTNIPVLKEYFNESKSVAYNNKHDYFADTLQYLASSSSSSANSTLLYGLGFGYIRTVIEDNICYLEGLFQAPEIEAFSSFIVDIEDISSSGLQILNTVQVTDDILSLNNNIIEGMDITEKNNVVVVDFTPQITIDKVKEAAINDRTEALPNSIPANYFNYAHEKELAAQFASWNWFSVSDKNDLKEITVRRDHEYNLEFNFDGDEKNTNILTTYYFTFNKAKYVKNTETNTFDFAGWIGEPTFSEISDLSEVREDLEKDNVENQELARFLTLFASYKQDANVAFNFDYNFNPLGSFNDLEYSLPYLKYCKLNSCNIKIKDNLNSENPFNYMNVYLNGSLVTSTELTVKEKDDILFELKERPEGCSAGKHNITWADLLKFKELAGMYGAGLFKINKNLIDSNIVSQSADILSDAEHYLDIGAAVNSNCLNYKWYKPDRIYIKYQKTVMVEEPIAESDGQSDNVAGTQLVEKTVNYWVKLSDQHIFWDKINNKFGVYHTKEYDAKPDDSQVMLEQPSFKDIITRALLDSVFSVSTLLLILKDDINNDDHTIFNKCFANIEIDNANYFPIIEYDLYSGNMTYAFQFNKTGTLNSFINTYPEYIQFHLASIRKKPDIITDGVKI